MVCSNQVSGLEGQNGGSFMLMAETAETAVVGVEVGA